MATEAPKATIKQQLIGWFVILVIIFIFYQACSSGDDVSEKPKVETHDAFAALYASRMFVEERLKAPATAEFSDDLSEVKIVRNLAANEHYTVRSYVDSENSFGAKLRTYYTCKIKFARDKVTCEDLILEE